MRCSVLRSRLLERVIRDGSRRNDFNDGDTSQIDQMSKRTPRETLSFMRSATNPVRKAALLCLEVCLARMASWPQALRQRFLKFASLSKSHYGPDYIDSSSQTSRKDANNILFSNRMLCRLEQLVVEQCAKSDSAMKLGSAFKFQRKAADQRSSPFSTCLSKKPATSQPVLRTENALDNYRTSNIFAHVPRLSRISVLVNLFHCQNQLRTVWLHWRLHFNLEAMASKFVQSRQSFVSARLFTEWVYRTRDLKYRILEAHRRAIVHWQRRILRSLASYCRKRVRVLVDLLPAIQRNAVLRRMWRIWQRGVRQQKESVCKCVAMFQCRRRLNLGTHLRFWLWRSRRRTILDEMSLLVLRKSGVTETRMRFTRWKCATLARQLLRRVFARAYEFHVAASLKTSRVFVLTHLFSQDFMLNHQVDFESLNYCLNIWKQCCLRRRRRRQISVHSHTAVEKYDMELLMVAFRMWRRKYDETEGRRWFLAASWFRWRFVVRRRFADLTKAQSMNVRLVTRSSFAAWNRALFTSFSKDLIPFATAQSSTQTTATLHPDATCSLHTISSRKYLQRNFKIPKSVEQPLGNWKKSPVPYFSKPRARSSFIQVDRSDANGATSTRTVVPLPRLQLLLDGSKYVASSLKDIEQPISNDSIRDMLTSHHLIDENTYRYKLGTSSITVPTIVCEPVCTMSKHAKIERCSSETLFDRAVSWRQKRLVESTRLTEVADRAKWLRVARQQQKLFGFERSLLQFAIQIWRQKTSKQRVIELVEKLSTRRRLRSVFRVFRFLFQQSDNIHNMAIVAI